ncbi:MAG TPA: MotA/TolQ/ExbB proton channel family protein [Firmicutes bacterium]|jgi:biopolymer transport protein ExbB|nr:MotA/TolQ/ExbB proton channel family protein [Bacillota bacterium]HOQ23078.1 MotA/TolQ/ExbB proton channel family protein [Bacillota bacterium]HPT66975.1 MotA/TolQ/ExbB proton channel family protein [Bacillota bacterium]
MWSVLVKGGFIMIPLCICSLVALYVIIERLIFYATYTEDGKALLRRIRPMIANGHWDEARNLVFSHPTDAYVRVLSVGLDNREAIKNGEEAEVQNAAQEELTTYQRGLGILDTIVTAAPMLGLLGTVTGIINSFQVLSTTFGRPSAQSISQGIAEALITTAAGLMIAIPALFFLNYFNRKVETQAQKLSQFGQAVVDLIRGGGTGETNH